jgi:hypothetical protein
LVDRCPTCRRLKKRGNPANARYWLLLHLIADNVKPQGNAYSPETWHTYFKHTYFKTRYLGADEVKLPNGKTINIPKSSAELDTGEFNDYMREVETWGQEHNVFMDDLAA